MHQADIRLLTICIIFAPIPILKYCIYQSLTHHILGLFWMYSPLLLFSSLLPSALQCYCDRCTANSSCTTDGVCFVALRRSGSQLIGEHRQCINENELIPRDRPFICAPSMREDLGIYPMCCTTDYCNKVADPELAHGKHTRTHTHTRARTVCPGLSPSKLSKSARICV